MGKLERELKATLDDLIQSLRRQTVNDSTAMDSLGTANRIYGAIAAAEEVTAVLEEGYVYYGTNDELQPATHWLALDDGAFMAIAEGEQRMPWDKFQPVSQLPPGLLVYRNKYGVMVDPRRHQEERAGHESGATD